MKRIVSQISTSEAIHPRKAGIVAFILEFSHSLSNRRQCCIVKVDAPLVRPPPGLSRITTLLIPFAVDIHTYPPPSTHGSLSRYLWIRKVEGLLAPYDRFRHCATSRWNRPTPWTGSRMAHHCCQIGRRSRTWAAGAACGTSGLSSPPRYRDLIAAHTESASGHKGKAHCYNRLLCIFGTNARALRIATEFAPTFVAHAADYAASCACNWEGGRCFCVRSLSTRG
jgi:hypothetical protein